MSNSSCLLLVGEVFVDFTIPTDSKESKLRLGGVVHAARGMWAVDSNFAVAGVCPAYLVDQVREYLSSLGCQEFIWLAEVNGSPNLITIRDPSELSDQGYEYILRHEKSVTYRDTADLKKYGRFLVFPGKYDLSYLAGLIPQNARVSFDIAYDLPCLELLDSYKGRINALITSTSSEYFLTYASADIRPFLDEIKKLSPHVFLLKENRGGSRLFVISNDEVEEIPALLGDTVNSVGVGDVFSAVYVDSMDADISEASWKASRAATCYTQTTFPNDLKRDIRRSLSLSVEEMRNLGGTFLPWHDRPEYQIYFAAPDFSYVERRHLDQVVESLSYHNFNIRRPIQENGEIKKDSSLGDMLSIYCSDIKLLVECDLVFALPLERDPGTLVEIGMALNMNKPVITFDPLEENRNTMVMAGCSIYSSDLNTCLNGVFDTISKIREASK